MSQVDYDQAVLSLAGRITAQNIDKVPERMQCRDPMLAMKAARKLTGLPWALIANEDFEWERELTIRELDQGEKLAAVCRKEFERGLAKIEKPGSKEEKKDEEADTAKK